MLCICSNCNVFVITQLFHCFVFTNTCLQYNVDVFQIAQNYFLHAAEAGNANAMAFLGKVRPSDCAILSHISNSCLGMSIFEDILKMFKPCAKQHLVGKTVVNGS